MPSLLTYRLKRWKRKALARLALASPKLTPLLGAPAPLRRIAFRGGVQQNTLIIFLPGIDDLAEDFERQGMFKDMLLHEVAADAVALDAHYGYYATRMIHERISEDVISSAQAAGYEHIWLAGISMGGFGAASYAARHSSGISGVLLFAPYLGHPALIGEIAAAGGIRRWEPGNVADDDYPRAVWAWFKRSLSPGMTGPKIYLGYGKRDIFARAHALLSEALPDGQVISIAGGHDWPTWKKIWNMLLTSEKHALREGRPPFAARRTQD